MTNDLKNGLSDEAAIVLDIIFNKRDLTLEERIKRLEVAAKLMAVRMIKQSEGLKLAGDTIVKMYTRPGIVPTQ